MASKYKQYYEEWRRLYEVEKKTYRGIATIYGCSQVAVWSALRGLGVESRSPFRFRSYHDKWCELYKSGKSPGEIAKEYGCTHETVSRAVRKKLGIDVALSSYRRPRKRLDPLVTQYDEEWKRLFLEEGMLVGHIAQQYKVRHSKVTAGLRRMGIDPTSRRAERWINKGSFDVEGVQDSTPSLVSHAWQPLTFSRIPGKLGSRQT